MKWHGIVIWMKGASTGEETTVHIIGNFFAVQSAQRRIRAMMNQQQQQQQHQQHQQQQQQPGGGGGGGVAANNSSAGNHWMKLTGNGAT